MGFGDTNEIKIVVTLEGNQAVQSSEQLNQSLNKISKSVENSASGFSKFQATLVTLNQALELGRKVFSGISTAAGFFFDELDRAGIVEGLSTAFENLQGGSIKAEESLKGLRSATGGLISDFDLFQQANNAVLLGVDDGSGKFAELAEAAVKLGRAQGITAVQAVNSLTVGVGRQSRLVLDNLGVIVRTESAYRDFAAANDKAADSLTESEKRLAFNAAAFDAISTKAANLAEIEETAAIAAQRLAATTQNLSDEFATGISSSTDLGNSINDFNDVIKDLDVEKLGEDIANLASSFVDLASAVAPFLTGTIGFLSDSITGFSEAVRVAITENRGFIDSIIQAAQNIGEIEFDNESIDNVKEGFSELEQEIRKAASSESFDAIEDKLAELGSSDFGQQLQGEFKIVADALTKARNNFEETGESLSDLVQKELKAAKEAEALGKKQKELSKSFEDVIKSINRATGQDGFDGLTKEVAELFKQEAQGILTQDELNESLLELAKQSSSSEEKMKDFTDALKAGEQEADKFKQELDKIAKVVEKVAAESNRGSSRVEELAKEFREVIKAGEGLDNVTDEVIALGQAALQAGASVGEIEKALKSAESGGGLGALGDFLGLGDISIGGDLDFGEAIAGDIFQGIQNALSGGSIRESVSSTLGTAGAVIGADFGATIGGPIGGAIGSEIGKQIGEAVGNIGKSTEDTIESLSTIALGPGLGDLVGGLLVDAFAGNKNAESNARDGFIDFIRSVLDENELQLVIDGQLQKLELNLLTDRSAFDFGAGFETAFEGLGEGISPQFTQIGEGLEEVLGITEDIGGQIGAILAENLGGSLNNLQILLNTLGISADQLKDGLREAFLAGELTANEALVGLQAVDNVMTKGIPDGIGLTVKAFDNLIASAGEGRIAFDALGDLGAEAIENQLITSLDDLKANLIENGASVEDVEKLFAALADAGVTSLEALRDASVDTAIIIQASLENTGFSFAERIEDLKEVQTALNDIQDKEVDITFNFRSTIDDQTRDGLEQAGGVPDVPNDGASAG